MNETIVAALIGGAAGILPVVVTKVFAGIENRSHLRQQMQALDLAKRRVDFVNAWMEARKGSLPADAPDGSMTEAANELDEIRASLRKVLEAPSVEARTYQERPFLQRLLLAYKPKQLAGWWWRVAYYTWTGAITASLIDGILRKDFFTGRDSGGEFSLAFLIGECIGAIILFLVSFYFHKRAVRSDRSYDQS